MRHLTPNLRASLSNALAFDNAYAHVPASNYFLVSAFASLIPELSAISTTYKTGDTDLWIRSVEIGGSTYHTTSFRELKDNVGHNSGDYYRFSRRGGAYIDLYLDENCLAASLETDSTNAETETAGQ